MWFRCGDAFVQRIVLYWYSLYCPCPMSNAVLHSELDDCIYSINCRPRISAALEKRSINAAPLEEAPHPCCGEGGGTHYIFGWGCAAQSWKPLPYFRPKYAIFTRYFRPDSQNVYPISDPPRWGNFGNSKKIFSVRDFVTPQTMCIFFFLRYAMSAATRYC